jgi:hypothetical protein
MTLKTDGRLSEVGWRPVQALSLAITATLALSVAGCVLGEAKPGPKPESNCAVENLRGLDPLPVYWLGESHEGNSLGWIRCLQDGDDVPHAIFNYGEPSWVPGSFGGGTWVARLEIDVQPYCGYSPDEFLSNDEYWDEDWSAEPVEVQIRGVKGYLQEFSASNSSLFLWSGDSSIHLNTWKSEIDVVEAAQNLIAIGAENNLAIAPLPSPTGGPC